MSIITVIGTTFFNTATEQFHELSLDTPKTGDQRSAYVLDIAGWILRQDSPITTIEVRYTPKGQWSDSVPFEDVEHTKLLLTIPVTISRPDVVAHYHPVQVDERCGFHATMDVLGLPPATHLVLIACCEDNRRIPLGLIHIEHKPLFSHFRPKLQPLMATGLGRSGTTWLMRLLSEHNQIVVQ